MAARTSATTHAIGDEPVRVGLAGGGVNVSSAAGMAGSGRARRDQVPGMRDQWWFGHSGGGV